MGKPGEVKSDQGTPRPGFAPPRVRTALALGIAVPLGALAIAEPATASQVELEVDGFSGDSPATANAIGGYDEVGINVMAYDDSSEDTFYEGTDGKDTIAVVATDHYWKITHTRDDADQPKELFIRKDRPVIIDGGNGDDVITGSPLGDHLLGGAGDDTIYGEGGDDFVSGQEGADRLFGGAGFDVQLGGDDGDQIFGGDDHDYAYGGKGADFINGGAGKNVSYGGDGPDVLIGTGERSYSDGGANADVLVSMADGQLVGGFGDDVFVQLGESNHVITGPGRDQVFLDKNAASDVTVYATAGDQVDGEPDHIEYIEYDAELGSSIVPIGKDETFLAQLESDVVALRSTPYGQTVLRELDEAEIPVWSMPASELTRFAIYPGDVAEVYYNPHQLSSYARGVFGRQAAHVEPWMEAPPIVRLVHEFGHVVDFAEGTQPPGLLLNEDNELVENFERKATGLPFATDAEDFERNVMALMAGPPALPQPAALEDTVVNTFEVTENLFRAHIGEPLRTRYRPVYAAKPETIGP